MIKVLRKIKNLKKDYYIKKCRNTAESLYSKEVMLGEYINLYNSLISK